MGHPLKTFATVAWALPLSSLLAAAAGAHETQPAVLDLALGDRAEMRLSLSAEAVLAGIDLSVWGDTDAAPEAAAYDALRALDADALAETVAAEGIGEVLLSEGLGPLSLDTVEVVPEPDAELPRETILTLSAPVTGAVRIGPAQRFGQLILRQEDEAGFAGLVAPGELSPPLAMPAAGGSAIHPALWALAAAAALALAWVAARALRRRGG